MTWHSVKEMEFEGGPGPWVLEPSRFFLELRVERKDKVGVAEVRLPAKRKQNLYLYRIRCLELGEQVGGKVPASVCVVCPSPKMRPLLRIKGFDRKRSSSRSVWAASANVVTSGPTL